MLCLAASAFAANWTGATSEPENSKKINGKIFYVITSAEELAWFAAQVNGGRTAINAVLANDIRFMDDTSKTSSVNWTPIGKNSSAMFGGIFNGAGKTVFGLYCEQGTYAGIFGVTDSNAVIRNVSSRKASIKGGRYAGGIVAFNAGTVTGCTNGGAVSSSYSGGIAGWNAGTVADCKNLGKVSATGGSGGVTYKNTASATMLNSFSVAGAAVSGVVKDNSGTVANCYYDSDVLTGKSTVAPNSGLHTADMQRDQFAWILNTTNGTAENSGVWNRDSVGYPIYADSIHKPIYKIVFDDDGATTNRYTNYKGQVSFPEDPEAPEGKCSAGGTRTAASRSRNRPSFLATRP